MSKKWIIKETKSPSEELINFTKSNILAQLLTSRNINTIDEAKEFLAPEKYTPASPFSFVDMKKSVDRIKKSIDSGEKVVVYGDFDCDGVTSTALLVKTLHHLGADIDFYVPDRRTEGHGLNSAAVCRLISSAKAKLIITVDCGISNNKEIKLAKSFGTDVIITDHHEAPEILPDAYAIINPKAPNALDESLSSQQIISMNYLAGVGVAYKLATALLEECSQESFVKELLPLAAIGTVGDVVPILFENRSLVKLGIEAIKESGSLGIKKLMEVSSVDGENFDAETIAFSLVPRINAAGRLDHAHCAVELLISENPDVVSLGAEKLQNLNVLRQAYCQNTCEQALEELQNVDLKKNKAIILYNKEWNAGIIGIVASKLSETFHRPVFLMTSDEKYLRCSARGVEGLNLYETLCEIKDYLEIFGGHAMAAGFSANLEKLDMIVQGLHNVVNENLDEEFLTPFLHIEKEITIDDLNAEFVAAIEKLAPFGEKNPQPVFCIKNLQVLQSRIIGSNKNHLKISFKQNNKNIDGLYWNRTSIDAEVEDLIDAAFFAKSNFFNNNFSIQLEIQDIKNEAANSRNKNSQIKYIDHRKKTDIEKVFFNYLKTTKTSISIFAENKATYDYLTSQNLFSASLINRTNPKESSQLVFFDLPPNREIVEDLIKKTSAKVVHLLKNNSPEINIIDLLKNLSGMLKYADSKLSGEINLDTLASKLCVSKDVVEIVLKLFNAAEIIEIIDMTDEEAFKIKFIQGKDFASLKEHAEYEELTIALNEINEFRNSFEFA